MLGTVTSLRDSSESQGVLRPEPDLGKRQNDCQRQTAHRGLGEEGGIQGQTARDRQDNFVGDIGKAPGLGWKSRSCELFPPFKPSPATGTGFRKAGRVLLIKRNLTQHYLSKLAASSQG
jgi:hypothetical protein